jgi:ATP-dependent DNA helicase RecQ
VPVVGRWAIVDPGVAPEQGTANSAQRIAAVGRRFDLHADVPEGSRILLVDDRVGTGWTLTMAARAIRAAGAAEVRPLVLATTS